MSIPISLINFSNPTLFFIAALEVEGSDREDDRADNGFSVDCDGLGDDSGDSFNGGGDGSGGGDDMMLQFNS